MIEYQQRPCDDDDDDDEEIQKLFSAFSFYGLFNTVFVLNSTHWRITEIRTSTGKPSTFVSADSL